MDKRILSILLAVFLCANLTVTVLAAETETAASTEATTEATAEPTQPEPTQPEPTQPEVTQPEPTQTPDVPTEPTFPTALEIDTENIYEGMDRAYEDGYVPRVEGGKVSIVLPLLSSGEIHGNQIKASLGLGTSGPFVSANYEKTFVLEKITPKNSKEAKELFLVSFQVALSADRKNGVYPVTVNISGYDASGRAIDCVHTLYVTITDGKSDTPVQTAPETPTAEPVVYIAGTALEPEEVMAGEEFTLTLTLKNSLTTKSVKNMLVRVDTGNLQINLLESSNVFPVEKIEAGGETELTLRFHSDASIPAGKYTLNFSFGYDSSKTLNLSSSGSAIVEIRQPANMELVMPRFAQSVTVGETIPLSLQVMNMGRDEMYNVRCQVSGFGFAPSNTGYIGTMAAGSSATTEVELYIIALNASQGNENGSQYGATTGTVTLIYEDASGEEYRQETRFDTEVKRPVVEMPQTQNTEEVEQKASMAWWVSILILGGVVIAAIVVVLVLRHRSRKGGAYL